MKKIFLPVLMLGFFAFSNVQAQTPVTVKKAPAPVQVTKAPPITVTKAPASAAKPATTVTKAPPINVAPPTKTTTTTTKTSTTKTTTPAKVAAPAQKTTTVKKTTVVKKTTTVATKHKAPAKKAVAKKAHTAPVAPPPPPPPPPPPVQEQVILPRPTEQPVVTKEVREIKVSSGDQMNERNDDEGNEGHKKACCAQGHHDCCGDKYSDQPWRFRHRHHSTYEYINNFYDRNCESGCKKHCDHGKKDKDNDD